MRLENLLDLSNREEPGLVKTIFDKVTGKELSTLASQIPKPKTSDVDYADPTMVGGSPYVSGGGNPYTPEVTQSDAGLDPEILQKVEEIDAIAKEKALGKPAYTNNALDPYKEDRTFKQTKPEPRGNTRTEADSQRRRNKQESNKNIAGNSTSRKTRVTKSATRGLGSSDKKGGAELDSRFGISGLNKGGLMKNKNKKSK